MNNPQDKFLKVFSLNSLLNEETGKIPNSIPLPDTITKIKSPVVLSAGSTEDIMLPPVNIHLPLQFDVVFNTPSILEDFGVLSGYEKNPNAEKELPADGTQPTSTPAPRPEKVKKYKIDYNAFYSIVSKKLSNTNIKYKLEEQSRAGVFKIGNFENTEINYVSENSVVLNPLNLYKKFAKIDKENESKKTPAIPITLPYGMEFVLVAKDNSKYTPQQIVEIIKNFATQVDEYILVDDEYITFTKEVQKVENPPEQAKPETQNSEQPH
jgi:hypothetical protein